MVQFSFHQAKKIVFGLPATEDQVPRRIKPFRVPHQACKASLANPVGSSLVQSNRSSTTGRASPSCFLFLFRFWSLVPIESVILSDILTFFA